MVENALSWSTMGGIYLEVLDCLREALADLPGGVMDFKTVDTFGMLLETGLTSVIVTLNGAGRAGVLRGPTNTKKIFSIV